MLLDYFYANLYPIDAWCIVGHSWLLDDLMIRRSLTAWDVKVALSDPPPPSQQDHIYDWSFDNFTNRDNRYIRHSLDVPGAGDGIELEVLGEVVRVVRQGVLLILSLYLSKKCNLFLKLIWHAQKATNRGRFITFIDLHQCIFNSCSSGQEVHLKSINILIYLCIIDIF